MCVLNVRDDYSSASTTILGGKMLLDGIATSRRIRHTCNNIIPRLTSQTRRRGIIPIMSRTVTHTNVEGRSLSTITFAHKPNLVNSLLINIDFTGNFTHSLGVPVVSIGRLRNRIVTRFVGRDSSSRDTPPFPFVYLLIDNKGSRVIGIGTCGSVRILNRAVSSTTNRTVSGYTGILR